MSDVRELEMDNNYIVTWRIELTAKTPHEAIQQAREIQLDPNNTATFFEVAIEHELQMFD